MTQYAGDGTISDQRRHPGESTGFTLMLSGRPVASGATSTPPRRARPRSLRRFRRGEQGRRVGLGHTSCALRGPRCQPPVNVRRRIAGNRLTIDVDAGRWRSAPMGEGLSEPFNASPPPSVVLRRGPSAPKVVDQPMLAFHVGMTLKGVWATRPRRGRPPALRPWPDSLQAGRSVRGGRGGESGLCHATPRPAALPRAVQGRVVARRQGSGR